METKLLAVSCMIALIFLFAPVYSASEGTGFEVTEQPEPIILDSTLDVDENSVLITVEVTDPSGLAYVEAVMLGETAPDTTPPKISVKLYDDGSHGDEVAGDNIYTISLDTMFIPKTKYTVDIAAADTLDHVAIIDDRFTFDMVVHNNPCQDGTLHGQCSANKPKFCSNGALVDSCHVCGCPGNEVCGFGIGYHLGLVCINITPIEYCFPKTETCNGEDDNCDGVIDEDKDGDGYFDPVMCSGVPGFGDSLDCDDTNPNVNKDAIELCDGIDNDCDGNTDSIGGMPLRVYYLDKSGYDECVNGQWVRHDCLAVEDCSNSVDNDCDGLVPENDWDCVKRVWTKPVSKWKWKYKWTGSCYARAWNEPDDTYNPAEHNLWGMNSNEWTCAAARTQYGPGVAYFLSKGVNMKNMGKIWAANSVVEAALPSSIEKIVRDAVKSILSSYTDKETAGRIIDNAEILDEPDAWAWTFGLGCPLKWASVYSFKRDWVCRRNTGGADKIFDWTSKDGKNWMTPVKSQGSCGSCWAFSAIGAIEAAHNIDSNNPDLDRDLSEQELVSCSGAGSCDGGYTEDSFDYIAHNRIREEGCFRYTAEDSSCSPQCSNKQGIESYTLVEPDRETMKMRIRESGPLSVCMDWPDEMTFPGGIGRCNGNTGDEGHCVIIVGYNDDGGYWIIKNSWGTGWFNSGYGKIGYGECDIESYWGSPTEVRAEVLLS